MKKRLFPASANIGSKSLVLLFPFSSLAGKTYINIQIFGAAVKLFVDICTKSDIISMYEIIQKGDELMHYLNANQYTYISGEINALYHEAAVKAGISDSVQNILYVICEKENRCLQSEISKLTGISRQTINSALRKLIKEEIVRIEPEKEGTPSSV